MNNEQHIRELAYFLWISEGKPDDVSTRHWDIATKMVSESHKIGQVPGKRSIDPSEAKGSSEPEQPDQT